MTNKKIRLISWIEEHFNSSLDPEIRERLRLEEKDVRDFDGFGYVAREFERLNPNRMGEVVEICTAFLIGESVKTVIRKIVGGYLILRDDLRDRPDDFWVGKKYNKSEYQEMFKSDTYDLKDLEAELKEKGLNHRSVYLICRLIKYIELLRGAGYKFFGWARLPDDITIQHIITMAGRAASYLQSFEGVQSKHINLSVASNIVNTGGFDFNNNEIFFDMKVKEDWVLTDGEIIQQLCTCVLARRLGYEFKRCIVFNPRWGNFFVIDLENVPADILQYIEERI